MAECTLPGDRNRCFTGGQPFPYYTEEQNLALMLEEHARGFRAMKESSRLYLEAQVSPDVRAWARALPAHEGGIVQGWQCPRCLSIHAPSVLACERCNNRMYDHAITMDSDSITEILRSTSPKVQGG